MSPNTAKFVDLLSPTPPPPLSGSLSDPDSTSRIGPAVHRSAAALLMEGKSPKEIAVLLRMPEDKVRALLKQQHTQEVIREMAQGLGGEAVENVLKAVELDAVFTLVDLMQRAESESVRFNAAKEIINRRRGNVPIRKPNEDEEGFEGDVAAQVHILDQRIASLIEQQGKKHDKIAS